MANYIILIAMLGTLVPWQSQARTAEDNQREAEQVMFWEGKLAEAKTLSENARMQSLWLGLRNMGYRKAGSDHGGGVDLIFREIQNELLAIPNHAQWIADEVERFRKESEHLGRGNQASYDSDRQMLIDETLRHLPSPETIKVLGNYLYDERDLPPKITFLPENAFLACRALADLGVRDAPVKSRPGFSSWKEAVAKQREWYAQVKVGTIPFSFVGQKVEYRFKPDGTWETLAMDNPPDDGPRPTKPINTNEQRPTKRQNPALASQEIKPLGNSLPWIVGVTIFLIGGASWVAMRKVSANSR